MAANPDVAGLAQHGGFTLANGAAVASTLDESADLYIFGYGSLIWKVGWGKWQHEVSWGADCVAAVMPGTGHV